MYAIRSYYVGVCIDTCHAFAAGYPVHTPEGFVSTFKEFAEVVGFEYLKGMHVNDSKKGLGSRVDRHDSYGDGLMGTSFYELLMQDTRFDNMPLILETPNEDRWPQEVAMLRKLAGDKIS